MFFRGDLVHQEDIVSLLRPFCGDASIAVQPRLDILQLLEQVSNINPFIATHAYMCVWLHNLARTMRVYMCAR